MWISEFNDAAVKDICYNCGSPMAKKSYNYFRRIHYVTKGKVWGKVWGETTPIGFYYATVSKSHVRLIEIAVRSEYQGNGYGRKLLCDLLRRMKENGLQKLTFRTPIDEQAPNFWLHLGATIKGIKGGDFEMELTIE